MDHRTCEINLLKHLRTLLVYIDYGCAKCLLTFLGVEGDYCIQYFAKMEELGCIEACSMLLKSCLIILLVSVKN